MDELDALAVLFAQCGVVNARNEVLAVHVVGPWAPPTAGFSDAPPDVILGPAQFGDDGVAYVPGIAIVLRQRHRQRRAIVLLSGLYTLADALTLCRVAGLVAPTVESFASASAAPGDT